MWQGCVVAEPQAGKYLCHMQRLDVGAENVQVIVPVEMMEYRDMHEIECRFYDSQEKTYSAFAAWETTRRERTA